MELNAASFVLLTGFFSCLLGKLLEKIVKELGLQDFILSNASRLQHSLLHCLPLFHIHLEEFSKIHCIKGKQNKAFFKSPGILLENF